MESISKISNLLESARDLTVEATQAARSTRGSTKNMSVPHIKKLLDSRNEREVLDGLRRVVSMMYRSQPCLTFFTSVVKNVASTDLEIKKLVYIYLVAHAEAEPDLALLSINTIQKSLFDGNPQVRALALKTMSGIHVPVISQIVSLAIKKGLGDMSPYVRRAAALAIPKCYRLDPNTMPQLIDHLSVLLGDKQPFVAGVAMKAFLDICPERIDLIHRHYRSLVKKLVDMDEWSQLASLMLMTEYARKCFPRRTTTKTKGAKGGFYGDEASSEEDKATEKVVILDPDLERLLDAATQLLHSRNSAVVVAVARCFVSLGTPAYMTRAVGPLIALLRGPQDIHEVALYNIVSLCLDIPQAFASYASHFLIKSTDTPQVWELKLELHTLIFPYCGPFTRSLILNELEHFSRSSDQILVRESVRAIGRCAQADPTTSSRCLRLLMRQINSPDENLIAESLTVIRHLIQQNPEIHTPTVIRLAKDLDTTTHPIARATIIWLVGEFSGIGGENNIAPDVLRILAKGFAAEAEQTKLQIVLLAAKVYLHYLIRTETERHEVLEQKNAEHVQYEDIGHVNKLESSMEESQHPISLLWSYILLLARYDTSYDLRDRTRLFKALLASPSATQLASLMLLAPKPVPQTPSPSESRRAFMLGSASLVMGDQEAGPLGVAGYKPLPEWVLAGVEPDPRLRESGVASESGVNTEQVAAGQILDVALRSGRPISESKISSTYRQGKTLDDWLAEEEHAPTLAAVKLIAPKNDYNEDGEDKSSEEECETSEDDQYEDDDEDEGSEGEDPGTSDDQGESESESGNSDQENERLVR